MAKSGRKPGRGQPAPRSKLGDREARTARKKRKERAQAADGVANGVVEIPGPLPAGLADEIRTIAAAAEDRERRRDPAALVLRITAFLDGLAIETESEKLAQHIADALARSKGARVERVFDDEGRRRILTCRFGE